MGRPWEAGKAVGASSPPHMGAVWVGWGPQEGVQHSEVCVQGLLALGWQTERASQGCVLRWWLLPKQLSSLAWVDSSGVAGSPCLSCICPCDHMSDNFFYFEILHTYARTHRILHLRQPPLCPPPPILCHWQSGNRSWTCPFIMPFPTPGGTSSQVLAFPASQRPCPQIHHKMCSTGTTTKEYKNSHPTSTGNQTIAIVSKRLIGSMSPRSLSDPLYVWPCICWINGENNSHQGKRA